jgi:hypothetical protein
MGCYRERRVGKKVVPHPLPAAEHLGRHLGQRGHVGDVSDRQVKAAVQLGPARPVAGAERFVHFRHQPLELGRPLGRRALGGDPIGHVERSA